MSGRATRVTARVAFFLCGLSSLFTGVPFVILRGSDLPVQSEWVIFVAGLGLVGLFSIAMAVLPRSWIGRLCGKDRDEERLFLAPLKWLGGFAAIFYVVAVVAHLAPHSWDLDSQVMFALCPLYLLRMQFDPSLRMTLFFLAPMNAGVYGALGVVLGYVSMAFRKRMA